MRFKHVPSGDDQISNSFGDDEISNFSDDDEISNFSDDDEISNFSDDDEISDSSDDDEISDFSDNIGISGASDDKIFSVCRLSITFIVGWEVFLAKCSKISSKSGLFSGTDAQQWHIML